jgi:hypothetical protein
MDSTKTDEAQLTIPPAIQMFNLLNGFMRSQAIHVAAKLGLADLLKDGARDVDKIAKLTKVNADALYRLLRALSSIGIFVEKKAKIFELTPMAETLRSDLPISLRPYALLVGDSTWWHSWGDLLYSVKTTKPAFDHLFNMNYDRYLERNSELAQTFQECMNSISQVHNPAIVNSYDFSEFRKVVDIGGGHGELLATIKTAYPNIEGILFEQSHIIMGIKYNSKKVAPSFQAIGGDFFTEVPAGGDLYILKQIIHDWNDEAARKILKNCRSAISPDGRILVIESVLEQGTSQHTEKFFDLHMLVTSNGGRERTKLEYQALFKTAGFKLNRLIKTASSYSIIEGVLKKDYTS